MWSRLPRTASFVQAAIGLLLCTLPVVIRPVNFPIACLVGVWYILTRFLFIADPSLGTHIRFALFPCFSQTAGIIWGACMSSLCKLIGGTDPHSSTTLAVHCVLLPLGLIPLCMVRATAKPPLLWVDGLFMVVLYGTISLLAFQTPSASLFWPQTVVYLLLTVALAAAAVALSGLLIPVLATRQLARAVAACMSGTADALNNPGMLSAGPQAATSLANPTASHIPAPVKAGHHKLQPRKSNNSQADSTTGHDQGIAVGTVSEGVGGDSGYESETASESGMTPRYVKGLDPPVQLTLQEWAAVRRLQAHAKRHEDEMQGGDGLQHSATSQFNDLEAPSPNVINGELQQHEYLQLLQQVTSPPRVNSLPFIPIKPWAPRVDLRPEWATVELRPQVAAARKLLGSASLEPPPFLKAASYIDRIRSWFSTRTSKQQGSSSSKDVLPVQDPAAQHAQLIQASGAVFHGQAWGGLLNGLSSLLDHLAALEAVASDVRVALALVLSPYGSGPERSHATALYQAAQHALRDAGHELQQHAAALRAWSGRPGPVPPAPEQSLEWHLERVSDAALLHIQAYWAGVMVHTTQGRPVRVHHTEQWRALHFCAVATLQFLRQLQGLKPKVAGALGQQPQHKTSSTPEQNGAKADQTTQSGVKPSTSAFRTRLARNLGWVNHLLPIAYGRDVWLYYWETLKTIFTATKQGKAGWSRILQDRQVQWGLKYWVAQAVVLVALFIALSKAPQGLLYSPFVTIFMYIASAATMSEKVETTVSKTFIRIIGTGLGCLVGWGLMYHKASAENPYAVVAVVVGVGATLGLLGATNFKYSAMLAYATLWSVALCQYCGPGCPKAGSTTYMLDRFVLVSIGCVLPVLISQLILPWYLSAWAFNQLGSSFEAAAELLIANHQHFRSQLLGDNSHDDAKETQHSSEDRENPQQGRPQCQSTGSSSSTGSGASENRAVVAKVSPGSRLHGRYTSAGMVQLTVRAADSSPREAVVNNTMSTVVAAPGGQHMVVTVTVPGVTSNPLFAPGSAQPTLPAPMAGVAQGAHATDSQPDLDVETGLGTGDHVPQQQGGDAEPKQAEEHDKKQSLNGKQQQEQQSSGSQDKPLPPSPSKPVKLGDMLGPLALVADGLVRDAPLWQRGALATPPLVHELMAVLTLLGDRLAAFQVALEGATNMSRSFSGWVAQQFFSKIDDELSRVVAGVLALAKDAALLLDAPLDCTSRSAAMDQLKAHLSDLMVQRSHVHMHLAELRHAQHERVAVLVLQKTARETGQMATISMATISTLQNALHESNVPGAVLPRPSICQVEDDDSQPASDTAPQPASNTLSQLTRPDTSQPASSAITPGVARPTPTGAGTNTNKNANTIAGSAATPAPTDPATTSGIVRPSSPPLRSLTMGLQQQGSTELPDLEETLSEVLGPGAFHPSDTVAWMACLYALARVLDAVLQVGRTVAEAGCHRTGPHPLRAADLATQSLLAWLK